MTAKPSSHPLDDLPLYLPRLFYTFLGVVELEMEQTGLAEHLQPGMAHVLLRLYEGDNCIIKDIGRSLRVANGTLTGLLNRMQRAGLIECHRCRQDGRATRVKLTALGRSLEPRVRAFHTQMCDIIQADFTGNELSECKTFLARMLNSLRTAEESLREQNITGSRKTTRRSTNT